MRLLLLLLAIMAVLFSLSAAGPGRPVMVGGWHPIKNINDPHVKQIADFAVSEYNNKSKNTLVFQRVIKGEAQVVAGQNFRLIISVKDNSSVAKYEAVVWERVWLNSKILTSFKPVK